MGLIRKKIPKEGKSNGKKYPWAESRICVFKSVCVCVCERERERERKKLTALVSLQSFLRH